MKKVILYSFIFLFFCPVFSYTQTNLTDFRVTAGMLQNVRGDGEWYDGYRWTFYPEVQIGGQLINDPFLWGVYYGFWDDGVSEPITGFDNLITYSFTSQIIGLRVGMQTEDILENDLIQMRFQAGFSHHMLDAAYIGGMDSEGQPGSDFSQTFEAMDADIGVSLKIYKPVRLYLGFQAMIQLNNLTSGFREVRNGGKAGILLDF